MQLTDGQRLIDLGAGTFPFAGMVADPAADAGKGVLVLEELQGLVVSAVIDQGDKSLNADMGRAGCLAGGCSHFVDAETTGDGLWILFVNCFAKIEFFVVLVGA